VSTNSCSLADGRPVGFDAIIGQQTQIQMLAAALRKHQVPHAMLFTGEKGIGKKTTAINFAMACNCKNPVPGDFSPCGACPPCRKIISGNHPDIHYVKPSGSYIKIEQIRTLCGSLALKPHEASLRFVLLSDVHLMNAEAGNALLKILEEPPEKTIFILTAPQTADILPTIVSRCRQIRFNPIHEDQLETHLVQKRGLPPEKAMIIASLSGGSMGRALSMEENEKIVLHRNWIVKQMGLIFSKTTGNDLYFAEALARDKETLFLGLEIMKSWFHDLAISKYQPERVINRDLKTKFKTLSDSIGMDRLIEKTNAVWQAERAIKANANPRLAIEALVIRLSA
jgi:DNA polymerase III subunit delta'